MPAEEEPLDEGSREHLIAHGYAIIRQAVPPELLEPLRVAHDKLLELNLELKGLPSPMTERQLGRTNIGADGSFLGKHLTPETAPCVEFWTHPAFHGVSSELLGVEDASVTEMMMLVGEDTRATTGTTTQIWQCVARRPFVPSAP